MSFILPNPFEGILCEPVHRLWFVIMVLGTIDTLISYRVAKYRHLLLSTVADSTLLSKSAKRNINKKVYNQFRSELRATSIQISDREYVFLPQEIIGEIMSMLPVYTDLRYVNYWLDYAEYEIPHLYQKMHIIDILQLIYPITRFITNLTCFVIILFQYSNWYEMNAEQSNWRKYSAFIISLFYLPLFNTKSIMKIPLLFLDIPIYVSDYDEVFHKNILFADAGYIGFWFMASIPIFLSGTFIFIPSTLLVILITFILIVAANRIWRRVPNMYYVYSFRDYLELHPIACSVSILLMTMWWTMTVTISSMALYGGESWPNSYRFGFFGEYCNETDYFQLGKWDSYSWDIQFLIFSWILF